MTLGMGSDRAALVVSPLKIRRPELIVEQPWVTVERFFTRDRSSAGPHSYDAYVSAGGSPPNRVVEADVSAINVTMGARSPHADWRSLIKRKDLTQLTVLRNDLDLFQTPDKEWVRNRVPNR